MKPRLVIVKTARYLHQLPPRKVAKMEMRPATLALAAVLRVYPCHVVRFRQFGAFLLLLIACAAPALACTGADAQMSSSERTCCHSMKAQCGPMRMPASHQCCRKTLPGTEQPALVIKVVNTPSIIAAFLRNSFLCELIHTAGAFAVSADHSPPEPSLSSTRVLRV